MTTDNRSTLFFLSSENEVDVFKDFVKSMDDSTKKMIEIGENNWDKVSRGMFCFRLPSVNYPTGVFILVWFALQKNLAVLKYTLRALIFAGRNFRN